MTTADLLTSIRHLPPGAQVTVTVSKEDLVRALEDQTENPDRVVSTVWCADQLGMSREWWADECRSGRIRGAFQEGEGSPWRLRAGDARSHLSQHLASHDRRRSRRRGPRKKGGRP